MCSTDEGHHNLRVPPGVWAMEVSSTIDQPSSSSPVVGSFPEDLDLRVYSSGWPVATFGTTEVVPFTPKVLVFGLVPLCSHPLPSAFRRLYPSDRRSWFLSLRFLEFVRYLRVCLAPFRCGPANRLGSISEGEGLTRRSNPQQICSSPNYSQEKRKGVGCELAVAVLYCIHM